MASAAWALAMIAGACGVARAGGLELLVAGGVYQALEARWPRARLVSMEGFVDRYALANLPDGSDVAIDAGPAVQGAAEAGADGGVVLVVTAKEPGLFEYTLRLTAPGLEIERRGVLLNAVWRVRAFCTAIDPRTDLDEWRRIGEAAEPREETVLGGPYGAAEDGAVGGWMATAVVPLEAGRYRVSVVTNDGVRVESRVGDLAALAEGREPKKTVLIDAWAGGAGGPPTGVLEVMGDGGRGKTPVELRVECWGGWGSGDGGVARFLIERVR